MKVAIVGSGISGLAAAARLHPHHDVTIFEASDWVGGHAHTVDVAVEGRLVAVDTGFIVFNDRNYPGFLSLIQDHGVATQQAPMSFSISDGAELEARFSNPSSIFARRRNVASPRFLLMLADLVRFNGVLRDMVGGEPAWTGGDRLPDASGDVGPTLRDVLATGRFGADFTDKFLVPFGSAVWSATAPSLLDMPARSYSRFMANHGLLGVRAAVPWRTVVGGSRRYVSAVSAPFADRIRLRAAVQLVEPVGSGVIVTTGDGTACFDSVVLATHSDTALRLLASPTRAQREVLGAIRYQPNSVVLHTDSSVMPRRRRAWAAWNAQLGGEGHAGASVTYWMNHLQSLPVRTPVLVSLNREVAPELVLGRFEYDHPILDARAMAAQLRRHELSADGVHFAGAYLGYGFHEDGVQAGFEAAAAVQAHDRTAVPA